MWNREALVREDFSSVLKSYHISALHHLCLPFSQIEWTINQSGVNHLCGAKQIVWCFRHLTVSSTSSTKLNLERGREENGLVFA